MQDCKSAATLIAKNPNLITNPETINPSSVKNYQLTIKTLIYAITQTCPDLAYSVSTLSKFFANPSKKYISTVKQVYCYLQETKFLSFIYQKDSELKLVSYINSIWERNKEIYCSNSRYVFTLIGAPVL